MTNTLNNVPRELLADFLCGDHDRRIMAERHLLAMLANAPSPADHVEHVRAMVAGPSPAGVDGLEVVAWQLGCQTMGGDVGYVLSWSKSGAGVCNRLNGEEHERALCRLSDAQGIIDGLRGENGKLQDQLHTTQLKVGRYADQRDQLAGLLRELFNDYKMLADSGDAGNWRLEETNVGSKVLAALAELTK